MKKLLIIIIATLCLATPARAANWTLNFSGYEWKIKNGGPMGPDANYWTNQESSVFVDNSGRLHLKISVVRNDWTSTEVYLPTSLGYGTYEFTTESAVDKIDKNLVLGLFLYQDDEHELDIEWTRWDGEKYPNLHFSVQPYWQNPKLNTKSIQTNIAATSTINRIDWKPDSVTYAVQQSGKIISQWKYTGKDNFVPGDERVHINFWIMKAKPPADKLDKEVIISQFKFIPLPTSTPVIAATAPTSPIVITTTTTTLNSTKVTKPKPALAKKVIIKKPAPKKATTFKSKPKAKVKIIAPTKKEPALSKQINEALKRIISNTTSIR